MVTVTAAVSAADTGNITTDTGNVIQTNNNTISEVNTDVSTSANLKDESNNVTQTNNGISTSHTLQSTNPETPLSATTTTSLTASIINDVVYGNTVTGTVTLKDGAENGINDQTVHYRLYRGNENTGNKISESDLTTANGGVASFTSGVLAASEVYTVYYNYIGNEEYGSSTTSTQFSVNPIAATLTSEGISTTYGTDGTANVLYNNALASGQTVTVTVKQNGEVITNPGISVSSGVATVAATVPAGTYTVIYHVDASGNYAAVDSDPVTVTVGKATPAFNDVGVSGTYGVADTTGVIKLTGVNGDDLTNAVTYSNANGITVSNGVVSIPTDLAAGTYTVTASYAASDNYNAASKDYTVTVNKDTSSVSVADVTVYSGLGATVVASVTGMNNVPLTGNVTFTVDGNSQTIDLTNNKSSTTFTGLSVGSHTVTATYNGDGNYTSSTNTSTITVIEYVPPTPTTVTTNIVGNDMSLTVGENGNFAVTLKD